MWEQEWVQIGRRHPFVLCISGVKSLDFLFQIFPTKRDDILHHCGKLTFLVGLLYVMRFVTVKC